MKALVPLVGPCNQEKVIVEAFSVIVKSCCWLYRADRDQQEEGGLHQGALADGLAQEDGPTWTTRIVVYGENYLLFS